MRLDFKFKVFFTEYVNMCVPLVILLVMTLKLHNSIMNEFIPSVYINISIRS